MPGGARLSGGLAAVAGEGREGSPAAEAGGGEGRVDVVADVAALPAPAAAGGGAWGLAAEAPAGGCAAVAAAAAVEGGERDSSNRPAISRNLQCRVIGSSTWREEPTKGTDTIAVAASCDITMSSFQTGDPDASLLLSQLIANQETRQTGTCIDRCIERQAGLRATLWFPHHIMVTSGN